MKKIKKSIKKKFELKRMSGIALCVFSIFIVISVMNKLIFKQDDWLYTSLSWSLAYGIGLLVRPFVLDSKREQKDNVLYQVVTIVVVFMLSAFLMGVLFNVQRWFVYTWSITVPYGVAIVVGRDFYHEEEYEEDEENEYEGIKII